jgi:hypothetical protein
MLFRRHGRQAEVATYAAQSRELATHQQVGTYLGTALANQARLAWRRGDLAAAEQLSTEVLARFEGSSYALQWLALWPALGVAVTHGRLSEAVEFARRLLPPPQQLLPMPLPTRVERAIQA